MRIRRFAPLALLLATPSLAASQEASAPAPAAGPPVQRIATASALSTEPIGSIQSVRELPDGRVLLNDPTRRRLLLMDSTLTTVEVVLDSLTAVSNAYGTRAGAILPYRADSTLFVDPASYAVLVLDPAGKIVRVRSVWRVQDLPFFTNATGQYGWAGVDPAGRIVYRISAQPARPAAFPPSGVPYIPPQPDSAFIVAVNLDTRAADTLGVIRIPKVEMRVRRTAQGGIMVDQVLNPLPSTDDWAILPDGTVAFVRGVDYRIDYRRPDGSWVSSAKLPYDWQRLADEDKKRMVDSVRTVQQRDFTRQYVTSMIRWVNSYKQQYPESLTVPEGFTLQPGLARDSRLPAGLAFPASYIYACAPGEEPAMISTPAPPGATPPPAPMPATGPVATGAPGMPAGTPSCIPSPVSVAGGAVPPPPSMRRVNLVDPAELPDYRPPLPTGGAARADADGNLWVRTVPVKPTPGGLVYDVIDPRGELVSRLQLPPGYTIVGFGRGRVVYLSTRDQSGVHLARVRLR